MKHYNLENLCESKKGEYVLGAKDLNTHACYMIFGVLAPGETNRTVKPGSGHEEILVAVDGELILHLDDGELKLPKNHAVHVLEDQEFKISNPGEVEVRYIMAGGHPRGGH